LVYSGEVTNTSNANSATKEEKNSLENLNKFEKKRKKKQVTKQKIFMFWRGLSRLEKDRQCILVPLDRMVFTI
jgi:hypothetical protein